MTKATSDNVIQYHIGCIAPPQDGSTTALIWIDPVLLVYFQQNASTIALISYQHNPLDKASLACACTRRRRRWRH